MLFDLQYIFHLLENEEAEWEKFALLKRHAKTLLRFSIFKAASSALLKSPWLLDSRLPEFSTRQASVEFCVCFSEGNDLRNISVSANLCPPFVFQQLETREGQDRATLV